ncbi:adenine nucleotide alpha hydrolases-like superfamily protein [Wolffia australiana]
MSSCGGGQSGCQREEEEDGADRACNVKISAVNGSCKQDDDHDDRCFKCREIAAVYNKLCPGCFRFSLYGKFKATVTSNGMISPTDKVLVALSGGPGSRVALEFVHEMQLKAKKSWDASKDQSLPVFSVGAVFIIESASHGQSEAAQKAIEEMRCHVSGLSPPEKLFHVTSIENILFGNPKNESDLSSLLETVTDATGKEDLLRYLRMKSLQKVALENGYSKLVLGSCTTTLACHVLSAAVKGQGYSLPADIQYVDSRWEIPIVLPLRDCLAGELTMLCHLDGHQIHQDYAQASPNINSLVSSFIARVQEENPSRPRTILRTGEKLRPFNFNRLFENLPHKMIPSRVRRKLRAAAEAESTPSEVLCPICGGPLAESDVINVKSTDYLLSAGHVAFSGHCCQSCRFQILPKDPPSLEKFHSLLPRTMTERVSLRKQIEDLLLSSDDEVCDGM